MPVGSFETKMCYVFRFQMNMILLSRQFVCYPAETGLHHDAVNSSAMKWHAR